MRQRVAIARAVACQPKILVMDEPFAAVGGQTRGELENRIRDPWHKLGVIDVFLTHDIDEAVYPGERVIARSTSPTVIMDDMRIDLPDARSQIETRSMPRFAELRAHLYGLIQQAQQGEAASGNRQVPEIPETNR